MGEQGSSGLGREGSDGAEQVAETLGPVGRSSGPIWVETRALRARDGDRGQSEVELPSESV